MFYYFVVWVTQCKIAIFHWQNELLDNPQSYLLQIVNFKNDILNSLANGLGCSWLDIEDVKTYDQRDWTIITMLKPESCTEINLDPLKNLFLEIANGSCFRIERIGN